MLIVGIAGCIVCIVLAGHVTKVHSYDDWAENGVSPLWIALGVAALIEGIAAVIVLRASADVVRLLKQLNGRPYSGSVTGSTVRPIWVCSECGLRMHMRTAERCPKCKAIFDET